MSTDNRFVIDVDGQKREFLLRLPAGRAERRPLVVMFHGTGGTAAWAADETGWSSHADNEGFLVAYPEALPPNPAKPAKFLTNPPSWHDGSLGNDDLAEQATDLRFIATMLDLIINRYSVDPGRIFLTGFSNGAGMVFAVATAMAERVAAIAPVAGHCWLDQPRPVRQLPTIYLVGSDDPLIPLQGGCVKTPWNTIRVKPSVAQTLEKWSLAIGCASTPVRLSEEGRVVVKAYPPAAGAERLLSLTIQGLGHHWPGGKGKLSEKIAGPRVDTIDACDRIWEFFRERM